MLWTQDLLGSSSTHLHALYLVHLMLPQVEGEEEWLSKYHLQPLVARINMMYLPTFLVTVSLLHGCNGKSSAPAITCCHTV